MSDEKKLKISHFTDPLCFWCYALEPEIRKIRALLADRLDYRIVMGVLSSDVHEFVGSDDWSDLRYEFFRIQMTDHLTEAASRVGMPFSPHYLQTCRPEELVSLPLSRAYCAMKMIDEQIAEGYLRRMRECVFAEGRSLGSVDELTELASEFPVDIDRFRSNLTTAAVEPILERGIIECRMFGVSAFPTLLMEYGDKRLMVQGYRSYAELRQAVLRASDGAIEIGDAEYTIDALERYVDRFGKAAAREIQTMFSLDEAGLADAMMDLVGTGRYKTQSCGNSYFAMPK